MNIVRKRLHILYVLLLLVMSGMVTSCFDDEFSTSSEHVLSFSTDSVKFDTIFTEQGTATKTFKVYNNHEKSLLITSIILADADKSGFFINVDGTKGPDVYNIEVPAKDSIFVFVEITPKKAESNLPFLIKDSIVFLTNGVRQDVKLEAYGQDALRLRGEIVTADTEYTSEKPYIIYDSLVVESGATLTLLPGTQLYMHDKAKIVLRGRLLSEGTQTEPVVLRGDRMDNMFSYLPYDRLPGQWDGMYVSKDSYNNQFVHTIMRGTVNGMVLDSSDVSQEKIKIHNSILHNSKGNLLTINQSKVTITNSEISNGAGALIMCDGGVVNVIQCTLANYFSLFEVIREPMLAFNRFDDTSLPTPPNAIFDNTIVVGSSRIISPSDIVDYTNILFRNCMFTVSGSDDANFINSIWGAEPMFNCVGGDVYYYDYRISTTESSAYRMGSESYLTPELRTDMYGVERPMGVNPDVGAYQVVELEIEN